MKKILLLVLVISMMSVTSELDKDYVKQVFSKTMSEEKAMEILINASGVDDGAVGEEGSISSENRAYDRIANSEELLIKLFDESKMVAGKVYALMGLRNLNLELYKKYYMKIDSEEYITVRSGCFIFSEKIGDYLKKTDYFNKLNN